MYLTSIELMALLSTENAAVISQPGGTYDGFQTKKARGTGGQGTGC